MMRATLEEVRTGMPRYLRVFVPPVSYEQFIVAMILLTALVFVCAWFGQLGRDRSWGVYVLVGMLWVLLINVLAHVVTLAVVGTYTAGLGTSLFINLPFSLVLLRRAWKEEWVERTGLLLLIPMALIVHTPILFGFLFLSGYISRFLFGV